MNEQFEDDLIAQNEAEDLYDDIITFFDQFKLSYTKNIGNGTYVTNIDRITGYPFYVAFGQTSSTMKGGFGFIKNDKSKPFILLNILNGAPSFQDIEKLLDIRMKKIIIHEIIHHTDLLRFQPTYKEKYSLSKDDVKNKIQYYNSPSELNTHYHEVLTYAQYLISQNMIENIVSLYPTVEKMTQMLYDQGFTNIDKYLTVKNKKRLKKRISNIAKNLLTT